MITFSELREEIIEDEGLRLHPYVDTKGHLSIGYGRNLNSVGISKAEAAILLSNDILVALSELDRSFPWWRKMPETAQRALANMTFNMGMTSLRTFVKMIAALKDGKYHEAAREAIDSNWAKQVHGRAQRIFELYRKAGEMS